MVSIVFLRSDLSVQNPRNPRCGTLCGVFVVIAWIQLEYGMDAMALIKGFDFLGVLPDTFQKSIPGMALPIPQRKIHIIRPSLYLMR